VNSYHKDAVVFLAMMASRAERLSETQINQLVSTFLRSKKRNKVFQ
jgi:hypothetical protein